MLGVLQKSPIRRWEGLGGLCGALGRPLRGISGARALRKGHAALLEASFFTIFHFKIRGLSDPKAKGRGPRPHPRPLQPTQPTL